MSDRLAELRRLRASLAEHAAWLDREIAAELARLEPGRASAAVTPSSPAASAGATVPAPISVSTGAADTVIAKTTIVASVAGAPPLPSTAAPSAPGAFPTSARVIPVTAEAATASVAHADAILDEYRVAPDALRSDVKKGCFFYFALAMLVVIGGIAILWVAFRR